VFDRCQGTPWHRTPAIKHVIQMDAQSVGEETRGPATIEVVAQRFVGQRRTTISKSRSLPSAADDAPVDMWTTQGRCRHVHRCRWRLWLRPLALGLHRVTSRYTMEATRHRQASARSRPPAQRAATETDNSLQTDQPRNTTLVARRQLRHLPNTQRPAILTVADRPSGLSRYRVRWT
jgi:hypothetical protein